jgi:hypothetical protein
MTRMPLKVQNSGGCDSKRKTMRSERLVAPEEG